MILNEFSFGAEGEKVIQHFEELRHRMLRISYRVVFLGLAVAILACAADAQMGTALDGAAITSIVYDPAGGTPIRKAAELLGHDLQSLTAHDAAITSDFGKAKGTAVAIGLADSPQIASILAANKISSSPIAGKWETYGRVVVPAPWDRNEKVLVIFGSDVRGTIWGVIDLTREMGVSAWEWWADVAIRKVDSVKINAALYYSKEPSVKYRGFFINTPWLANWSRKTFDPAHSSLGPKTYRKVCELMWRLKANMLWPDSFNDIPENYDALRDYAIVRGTSHVDMMLRNNEREWNTQTMGPYNWLTNRERLVDYWKGDVEKFGKYDNLYTIGMRGASDFPMEGANTPDGMANILRDVIKAQRKILADEFHKPADQVPQVFTPYKEILAAYNTGKVDLPDDVTIIWPDDNYGYMLQLDNPEELKRSGGAGVYYHFGFWGAPAAYLWLGSTDPSLVWEEMTKAYHFGARNLWVSNSSSIKTCEFLTQFFLDMAFDMDAFSKPSSVRQYLRDWAGQNFGVEYRDRIADIMWRYYKLAFNRNPEFMTWSTTFPETSVQLSKFNMLDFGDENARRAAAYKSIIDEASKLMASMPDERKEAFYELIQYIVDTGANFNLRQLDMDKAITYGLQSRASANVYAQQVSAAQDRIAADTVRYNTEIENGKWNGIVKYYPHPLPNYEYPYIPTWKAPAGESRCGVQVEGGGYFDDKQWWFPTLPTYHPELGGHSYYLDVFTEQPVKADWSAQPNESWITVDHTSGTFSPGSKIFEQRIQVSVNWAMAPKQGDGTITVKCSSGQQPIDVHVRVVPPTSDKTASFIDSQGVVSMYADHADIRNGAWKVLDGVGHTGADVESDWDMAPVNAADPAALAKAPNLVYRFVTLPPDRDYSFPNYVLDKIATIKAIALPTFPITKDGHLRIAISLDGGQPEVRDFRVEYYAAKWRENVMDNAAVVALHDVSLMPGSHTLTVYALDPGIVLDRFEIDFAGANTAYGPVPETRIER